MSVPNNTFTRKYNTIGQQVLQDTRRNRQDARTRFISVYCTPTTAGNYQFLNAENGKAVVLSPNDVVLSGSFKGNGLVGTATFSIGMALTASGAPAQTLIAPGTTPGTSVANMNVGGVVGVAIAAGGTLLPLALTGLTNRFLNCTTATGTITAGTVEGMLLIHTFLTPATGAV